MVMKAYLMTWKRLTPCHYFFNERKITPLALTCNHGEDVPHVPTNTGRSTTPGDILVVFYDLWRWTMACRSRKYSLRPFLIHEGYAVQYNNNDIIMTYLAYTTLLPYKNSSQLQQSTHNTLHIKMHSSHACISVWSLMLRIMMVCRS